MLMFLSILAAGVVVTALCAALMFAAEPKHEIQPESKNLVKPSQFFGGDVVPAPDPTQIPIEVVLSQIERHIRLEQAAAKAFLDHGTPESPYGSTHTSATN